MCYHLYQKHKIPILLTIKIEDTQFQRTSLFEN